jgi:hypothetical protein
MDGDKEIKSIGPTEEPALGFAPRDGLAVPTLSVSHIVASDHVEVSVRPSEPVLLHLLCLRHLPNSTGVEPAGEEGKPVTYDGTGKPQGGVLVAANKETVFTFPNLMPENTYSLKWEAYAEETGKKVPEPDSKAGYPQFATLRGFSFTPDGMTVLVSPSTLSVSWTATDRPESAQLLMFTTAGSLSTVDESPTIDGNKVSFSVPLAKITGNILPRDPQSLVKAPPLRLKAIMKRGAAKPETSVALAFEIPRTDKDKQDAIDAITKAASENKGKIKWAEIVKVGLPLILRIAL